MEYPNSTFIIDHVVVVGLGRLKYTILVVGVTKDVVIRHVQELFGFKSNPIYLPNCKYPTIWDNRGVNPEPIQVKILYTTKDWII
jgi:hypothetical protein